MSRVENLKLAMLAVTIILGLMAGPSNSVKLGKAGPALPPVPEIQTQVLTG